MAVREICVWRGLILALFLFGVDGQKRPLFMVTFPAVIESGSNAKLCASLLKPQESLTMTVSLLNDKRTTRLVQQVSSKPFHRCFSFQAPRVDGESVQMLKVEVQGNVFRASDERKVLFKRYLPLTFIQTDKPIYNPGQTVNFRVVTMDAKFVPLDQMYNLVVVEDNNNNRIGQWTNISSTDWILQLSHELNPEAQMGMYTLKAFIGEQTISHVFEVKKYVLPKFDVTVNTPQMYSVGDVGLKVEACAKYTYGQPVPGQALVEVCRDPFPYAAVPDLTRRCLTKTAKMNATGCVFLTVDTSVFFGTKFENNMQDTFFVSVNVTEEGTDVVMSKSATVSITFEVGKVKFVDIPEYFEPGSKIDGKISVSRFDGTPIANKVVYLLDGNSWPNKVLMDLTTNQDGLATFSLNTANLPKAALNLVASVTAVVDNGYKSPYFTTDTRVVQLLHPDSSSNPSSELTIVKLEQPLKCGATFPVTVKYSFVGEAGDYSADIIYMVLSRGVIVLHGFETVKARASSTVTSGSVSFQLSVSGDMAPEVQILVYCVLPSENVVVGSALFETETCLPNQVSLKFSPATAVPAEKNVLTVSAQAGSLCGISAVDQSIRILEPGRRLSAKMVFDLLPVRSLTGYPYNVQDEPECLGFRPRLALVRDPAYTAPTNEAYTTFKSLGMKVLTNLAVQAPPCPLYPRFPEVMVMRRPEALPDGGDTSFSVVTVRSYFPETWLWQLVQVGNTGSTRVPLTVPDTITTWETEAFCLSSKGFGLAPPALLTVFQPFFLELSLPYSIVRGESFDLKATVFSYLSKCIMVKVTPDSSTAFTLKPYSEPYVSCLCANGRKTFKWVLSASVLGAVNVTVSASAEPSRTRCGTEVVTVPTRGRIDVVTRSLLVLPEGVERTNTQSWLLCPKGNVLYEDVTLTFPTNVVQGSARCSVSVLGDIMGRALKNLDRLLQMPSGCGEQNMIILAPNIYILLYLKVTGQLTAAIRETATGYLQSGYQGQLNYRHTDGSFSTFGYDASNTWLTAFVMRSFGLAREFIFIDPNVLQSAKDWLISTQGSDGCFIQQGTLYHSEMKGGVGDSVTMTAYIVAALLELGVPTTDPVVTNGLSCLTPVIGNLGNTYATALLTYTFSLAGETTTRSQLLTALDSLAISEGTKLHWSQTTSGDTLAVEISSYVLLAVLAVQPLTTADLGYANRIVNWLVTQQNPYGGFSSTQDTVVALHALSVYAAQVFSLDGSSSVTVQSSGGDSYSFKVNRDNRLLYQEKLLKNVPGKYSVKVSGSTCVSLQVACFYNIPTPVKVSKTLRVEAKVTGDCQARVANLMLKFTVKYDGVKSSTNMVIVDIKLLSGFTADTSLLGSSPQTFAPLVERVDAEDDGVLVYLKEVPKGVPMSYTLQLNQVLAVENLKPAVIKVYDYYQTKRLNNTGISAAGLEAPQVDAESVQTLKVEVQGKIFRGTAERKVMFRRYLPLTFIQTDKPIYNPGQTVNFTVVSMDAKFVPVDQMYDVVVEDYQKNRISQWTNISSTEWILQLSHELNPEAQIGKYTLKAFIGERTISHVFEVKKYVLPKFDVTVNTPQMYSVGDEGLNVEACAKYTYGQPVPGQVLVEVCRELFPYAVAPELTRWCLNQTAEMNATGCASLTVDTSMFFNTKFENRMQDTFLVNVNITEEGTDIVMSKSATVSITFEVGKVAFVDIPDHFEPGSVINGKISVSRFDGTPIANKVVYLLDGNSWPNKQLMDLTTNQKGLATFSLNTANLPKAALNLLASVTPAVVYSYKSPYFTTDSRVVQLLQPGSFSNPSSALTIVTLEQPLKCGATFPVTVEYSFVGEAGGYSTDIIFMVLSRGIIVLHGFRTVTARASNTVMSGSVSFQLSVSVDMAPVVQILVYCVLPSENVVVGSASFDTEMCLPNQVSLKFSPATAVPAEKCSDGLC
ncbi:pregnancy zone protein [Pimephales promelas]|nr:pregnancy zone protein [Pimephales promelas]